MATKKIDWNAIRGELDYLEELALRDMLDILRVVQPMDIQRARAYLQDAMPILVDTYGGVASDISAAWWDDLFADLPEIAVPAQPAVPPPASQIAAQTGWASAPLVADSKLVQVRLASVLKQHILGAQRQVVAQGSQKMGVRYARHARNNACGFCRVLASRGAVYGSSARAKYVGATGSQIHYSDGRERGRRTKQGRVRGVQKAGETYHDHCKCVVGPETVHLDANYPDYYEKFEKEYQAAVGLLDRETGGQGNYNMSAITRVMRTLGYAA